MYLMRLGGSMTSRINVLTQPMTRPRIMFNYYISIYFISRFPPTYICRTEDMIFIGSTGVPTSGPSGRGGNAQHFVSAAL